LTTPVSAFHFFRADFLRRTRPPPSPPENPRGPPPPGDSQLAARFHSTRQAEPCPQHGRTRCSLNGLTAPDAASLTCARRSALLARSNGVRSSLALAYTANGPVRCRSSSRVVLSTLDVAAVRVSSTSVPASQSTSMVRPAFDFRHRSRSISHAGGDPSTITLRFLAARPANPRAPIDAGWCVRRSTPPRSHNPSQAAYVRFLHRQLRRPLLLADGTPSSTRAQCAGVGGPRGKKQKKKFFRGVGAGVGVFLKGAHAPRPSVHRSVMVHRQVRSPARRSDAVDLPSRRLAWRIAS